MTLYTQNIQGSQDVLKIKDYLVRIIKNSNTHTHTHKKSSKLSSEYALQKQTKEKKKRLKEISVPVWTLMSQSL